MNRTFVATLLAILFLLCLPLRAEGEARTYDFTGYVAGRDYEPDGGFDLKYLGVPGEGFNGSITLETTGVPDHNPDRQIGVFDGVVRSVEIQFGTPNDRVRYSQFGNGRNELLVDAGSALHDASGSADREEIRLTMRDVMSETGIRDITMVLLARAANRGALERADADTPLTALPAQLWELQFRPAERTPTGEPYLIIGRLTAMRERPRDLGGTDRYANSDFPRTPESISSGYWLGDSGAWAVMPGPCCSPANQYFTNTSIEPFATSLFAGTLARRLDDGSALELNSAPRTDYSLSGVLRSENHDGSFGALYNYRDEQNFYELRFFPSGLAAISKVVAGVRTVVARAPFRGGHRWSRSEFASHGIPASLPKDSGWHKRRHRTVTAAYEIIRTGMSTTVIVNGRAIFRKLRQPELGGGAAGIFASDTTVRFQHFVFRLYVPRLFPPDAPPSHITGSPYFVLPFDIQFWQPRRGTWEIDRSTLSYANTRREPHALSTFQYDVLPTAPEQAVDTNVFAEVSDDEDSSVGVVYEFANDRQYYEVALFDDGRATLVEVLGGVRSPLASSRWAGGFGRWLNVGVVRHEGRTSVEVNGDRVFDEVPQPAPAGHDIGLTSHLKTASFNRIVIWSKED